jgi:hypothetical protein
MALRSGAGPLFCTSASKLRPAESATRSASGRKFDSISLWGIRLLFSQSQINDEENFEQINGQPIQFLRIGLAGYY